MACYFESLVKGYNDLKHNIMNRPKNPTGTVDRNRTKPAPKSRPRKENEELKRSTPVRRNPESEKRDRVVNEDEQLKVVNQREDNAQSRKPVSENEGALPDGSNENERLEAADDNNEVNPRSPKVN